jgi:hypothetical protein
MGQSVGYVRREDLMNAGETGVVRRHYDPEIEKALERNAVYLEHLPLKAFDLCAFYNSFTQHVLSINSSKIVQLKTLEAEYSRVSRFNLSKGTSDRQYVYYSGEFSRSLKDKDLDDKELTTTLKLHDPLNLNFFAELEKSKTKTFATHTRVRTMRSHYYATPTHKGLYIEDGWVDNAANVPKIVNTLQNKQASIKQIIYVSVDYMKQRYDNWIMLDLDKQQELFDALGDELTLKLSGTSNINSTIALLCTTNGDGSFNKTIWVEPVADKLDRNGWVPDADHSNKHIVMGHNMPQTMFGIQNSNVKMNSESGSTSREGFNTMLTLNTPMQMLYLSDLQLMANYNRNRGYSNWDVVYFVENETHTTTNNQESGIQKDKKAIVIK